ncbi:helix-turn-helix protein [Krasilnikovia cinnamomea]|uniref:Helix-turn-helix protein n=1 Tax=Krasilnikovia cinnamomea TaxID=349313 RepID=A0A4Q7ZIN8_9ACTN|nr:helix-turn-helix transcriptional regulator [Krasilnikovia cinnamomea]RZU50133.1 helix-turn-helix protein [Krasilnikovia cinnamomea]
MEIEPMPTRRQPPTVRRRRLAAELLSLRSEAGLTREQVAVETGLSTGALFRIEKAQTRPQKRTLRALLDLYGVNAKDRRDELEALLRQSGEVGWLQLFEGNLVESYATLISFEAEAFRESVFELSFVPGLLQTEAYAEMVTRALMPEAEDDEIERRVEVRMRRQQALTKPSKLSLWAILDEAVIRRKVGGDALMREQLEHLIAASRRPNVTIQVVPFGAGAHLGMPGSFLTLEFSDPDPPLIYTENSGGGLFLEQDADVARYRSSFQRLAAQALSPDDTLRMIKEAAEAA